jgi:hypothetical protein
LNNAEVSSASIQMAISNEGIQVEKSDAQIFWGEIAPLIML